MEKIKTKIIIILSIILFIVITISIIVIFSLTNHNKKTINKLTENNKNYIEKLDTELKNRDIKIKELLNNPIIIDHETIVKMNDEQKESTILDLQNNNLKLKDIIIADSLIISDLKNRLIKTNDILNNRFIPKHSLCVFGLAGLDKTLDIDIYLGILYRHYFFENRFYLGGGMGVKMYKELGLGLQLEIGFNF